jgi:hypothetical protein
MRGYRCKPIGTIADSVDDHATQCETKLVRPDN